MDCCNDFIIFNIIGTKFCVKKQLFINYPKSLLHKLVDEKLTGNLRLPSCICKISDNEFYVERSPDLFKIIILYCINNKLHVPSYVCSDEVTEEFHFWNIKYEKICSNCASHHYDPSERLSDDGREKQTEKGEETCRNKLWKVLDDPRSSTFAFVSKAQC